MPQENENLYLKTGLIVSGVKVTDNLTSATNTGLLLKIPIQLEYLFPTGTIRPKFSTGVNLYQLIYPALELGAGINIKIKKTMYWAINSEIDFNGGQPVFIIPRNVLSYSILTGIHFSLK